MPSEEITNPNRIGSPVTVANAATDAKLAPVQPGAGGWTPPGWVPLLAAVAVGVLGSVGAVIAVPGLTMPVIVGAVLAGIATGLSTFFGIKSAGPRKLDQ